jgi:hypothetical protein
MIMNMMLITASIIIITGDCLIWSWSKDQGGSLLLFIIYWFIITTVLFYIFIPYLLLWWGQAWRAHGVRQMCDRGSIGRLNRQRESMARIVHASCQVTLRLSIIINK